MPGSAGSLNQAADTGYRDQPETLSLSVAAWHWLAVQRYCSPQLQPRLSGYVRPGGQLVLSGILVEQVPEIQAAYSGEFEGFVVRSEGSWAMLTATKAVR